jgi:Na+-transporting methylmalonyl-CoA/oxaloacetate decarboxylase gamma subunit
LIVGVVFGVVIILAVACVLIVAFVPAVRSRLIPSYAADRAMQTAQEKLRQSNKAEMATVKSV